MKLSYACRHATIRRRWGRGKATGLRHTWLRPQPGWAPLATTFAWSVVLWALILLVVTDGSSSSFVGFSLLELVCVFSKYEFLHCAFLVSFALSHVSYLKIAYIPKLVERLDLLMQKWIYKHKRLIPDFKR